MHIGTIMWANYLPLIKQAADTLGIRLSSFSTKQLNTTPGLVDEAIRTLRGVDCILVYRTNDAFWDEIEPEIRALRRHIPVISISSDPSFWELSSVAPETVATAYRYLLFNGQENIKHLLGYILHTVFGMATKFCEPEAIPWEGIHHPADGPVFQSTDAYLSWYASKYVTKPRKWMGLLYSRSAWATNNLEVERALVNALEEKGIGVIPVFFYPLQDSGLGNLSGVEVVERFFLEKGLPIVDGLIKLTVFFLSNTRGEMKASDAPGGVGLMKRLNVPLFSPVLSYYQDIHQWLHSAEGLGGQVGWSIALPEFEGVIEPMIIGASQNIARPEEESYEAIHDRIFRFVERVDRWLSLAAKPNSEKRIAFVLHCNPCASMEATVGGAAHLDSLESVAEIMKRMVATGYTLDPPPDGKTLIDSIMDRKAISEFRWTTVEEIVAKGGVLAMLPTQRYEEWFQELPEPVRVRMTEAWGAPPGEPRQGVPAAMLYQGNILVTGVRYGNVLVCVQPKRGCAGARCDGQVCKILHDPDVPPPHQYVATYKWLSRDFGADAVIHVGTHGNLEFLPGKATGLSSRCYPDICIDSLPHLYIYNADNPPEGTIAKRRAYAALVDHMQTVMVKGELYGDLEQLERLLDEYQRFRQTEPARAHTIQHMIMDQVTTLNLLDGKKLTHENFSEKVRDVHDALQLLKQMHIPKGMHIFGRTPEGERLADFVHAIVRFDTEEGSLRWLLAQLLNKDVTKDENVLREQTDEACRELCHEIVVKGQSLGEILKERYALPSVLETLVPRLERSMAALIQAIRETDEIGALLNGLKAGYIEPGPSGLITRGRRDILPTGRNFFSLDPYRIPTASAWEVGKKLADKTLEKYVQDEGRFPETIAFYWQCSDIMWADGEGMAQIMYLLGAKPVWHTNGRLKGFEVIPLSELGRPRVDVTIRVSGITRDNFPSTIEMLDEIVQKVAMLDEPLDQNYVRQHTLERLQGTSPDDVQAVRAATYRIFASMPGTYQAGTQLAVYASAWKTERDLSDVFLYWNGYAYGKGVFGEAAHGSLRDNLRTVEVTFNKTVSDEYDLTGCCCYFGAHGGMINAARVISGKEIANYYGDTREQDRVTVRTLTEEMRRLARGKLLNPTWIEGMMQHGYRGASEISKRVGRIYGWQATAKAVDDSVFDDITRTFVMDERNRKFFEEQNPWALEEMVRRLIEAAERDLWSPAPDVKDALKELYVEIEGWLEGRMDNMQGDFQGGSIDIVTAAEVEGWKKKMEQIL